MAKSIGSDLPGLQAGTGFHRRQTINILAHEIRVGRATQEVSRRLLGQLHSNREGIALILLDEKRKETMF